MSVSSVASGWWILLIAGTAASNTLTISIMLKPEPLRNYSTKLMRPTFLFTDLAVRFATLRNAKQKLTILFCIATLGICRLADL